MSVGSQPEPDELLSFFPRKEIDFLDNSNATHETIFNYYFDNKHQIDQYYDIQSIEPIDNRNTRIIFHEKVRLETNYSEILTVEYDWQITFDENYRFASIKNNSPPLSKNIQYINLPTIPTIENNDLKYSVEWCNEQISYQYFDAYFINNFQINSVSTPLSIIAYQMPHFFSIYNPLDNQKWENITKVDREKFNIYLHKLKQFFWNNLYENLLENNEAKSIAHRANLLACFEIIWTANIYQYQGDKKIESPSNSQLKNLFSKIPLFDDKDFSMSVLHIHRDNMNTNLVKHLFPTYDHDSTYLQDSKEYFEGYNFDKMTENLTEKDKEKFNEYRTKYLKAIKEINLFLQTYM
jgi:hypothetical protein